MAITIGAALWLLPRYLAVSGSNDQVPVTTTPRAFSQRPPFGEPLEGAVAYLSHDRLFTLVDLTTGHVLGSKGVPTERRPAAASSTNAYLGSVPALRLESNWDQYRSLPWDGTQYRDHVAGTSIAYSQSLDTVAAAMRPLPEGDNGVVMVGWDDRWVASRSGGMWSLAVWAGDRLLVRELSANDTHWWLIDGVGSRPSERIQLPDRFLPIAGRDGLVLGQLGGAGAIGDLDSGAVTALDGPFSWAADWSSGEPLVATIGGDPPLLYVYDVSGGLAWSAPLSDPVTRFRGGVSWAPDGSYVIVASGGTLQAFTRDGHPLGDMNESLPPPQGAAGTSFVVLVESPERG